ncbi:MAG: 23S rRNA (pseudouridine(1915)-N(3))-methyltransferase RlmH [Sulfuriferula sp.]
MKLHIIAIGQKMPGWINAGFAEYAKRMPKETSLHLLELKPEKRSSGKTAEQIKSLERDRILASIPHDTVVWALDEHGEQFTTLGIADQLRNSMGTGRNICFIIGGADGLHDDIKRRGDKLFSLSRLTLPHGLVRVLLAEQLYRAWSVTQNHPYHRE